MNCEQCKEEVLELIEREAVDPAGVREILDRCPDCRALFDEMKAALVAVDQLPLEDPSARVDADILRAAVMRRTNVARVGKRRFQAPPWAMAAIALLAVGIGVWAIPGDNELATEDGFGTPLAESDEDIVTEPRPASAPVEVEEAVSDKAEQGLRLDQETRAERQAEGPPKTSVVRRKRAQEKRRAASAPVRQAKAVEAAPEEASDIGAVAGMEDMVQAPAANARAAGAARTVALADESADQEANKEVKEDGDDTDATCRKTVADFEKRRRRDAGVKPDPEQELALGRCYAKLGDAKRARTWLERAAAHPKTKTRAQTALEELAID
ncbi:MAG: hypothetical protein OEM15_16355 [Myxococcales bacterium]|nr:hypothetical protein [Myxococcales bacterium]MDH3484566.1 hypothetical protein [Myxococcales bacterium]